MTHSYGNGRRLDDSKALAELNFEVNYIFIHTVMFAIFHTDVLMPYLFFCCRLEITWMSPSCRGEDCYSLSGNAVRLKVSSV